MRYIENIDYFVHYLDFRCMASESVVVSNGDGTFTIYLNTQFPDDILRERLAHEVRHLENEHFFDDCKSIRTIEHEADSEAAAKIAIDVPAGMIPCFHSLDVLPRYFLIPIMPGVALA